MVRTALGISVAVLLLTVGWASADDDDEETGFQRPGWYVGAGGTYAVEDFSNTGAQNFDDSGGVFGYVGYRYNPYFATDLLFEWIDEFDDSMSKFDRVYSITVNGKLYLPLDELLPPLERVQPYVLGGFGLLSRREKFAGGVDDTEGRFTGRLGGGVDFYITDKLVLTGSAAYMLPTAGLDDLNFVSLGFGIQYRFAPSDY